MNVVVLGAGGMLGNAMFRILSASPDLKVLGTVRDNSVRDYFDDDLKPHLVGGLSMENTDGLLQFMATAKPSVVINCIGLVKQLDESSNPLLALSINSLLPHRLALICEAIGARLIHISTDCVFSGARGHYREEDFPDADDLYGRSKLLGEVASGHTLTLRTSIIGHELSSHRSLIGWFLRQRGRIKGFTRAVFSGLPTVELSSIVRDFVLTRPQLHGLYHVAATPINKYELLRLVAAAYDRNVEIVPDDGIAIDRSLNADRFNRTTGYVPPPWPELVARMCAFK